MSVNSISINNFERKKPGKLRDKEGVGRGISLSPGDLAVLVINWARSET
jgi:hypothetical protein